MTIGAQIKDLVKTKSPLARKKKNETNKNYLLQQKHKILKSKLKSWNNKKKMNAKTKKYSRCF